MDDVAIWGVLVLILMDWQRIGKQLIFLSTFATTALVLRWFMVRLPERDRWYVGLVWLALCGLGADWSGLHFMVGAFLSGAVIESRWFDQKQIDALRQNVLLIIMPVFFLSPGLRTTWTMGGPAVLLAAGVLLITSTTFTDLLLMAVGSTMLTLPMATARLRQLPSHRFACPGPGPADISLPMKG